MPLVALGCPQPRETPSAPQDVLGRTNPLPPLPVHLKAGERLFNGRGNQHNCADCHGKAGDGKGPIANLFQTKPRDFTCTTQMETLSDGQLFWAIRTGINGTVMPASPRVSDEQIWQLVLYIRQFAQ
ncbi:MAG: cytochrome c [Burkholderiales bacterium]|nr:cytochrome c [Burkholderiales bacterium]